MSDLAYWQEDCIRILREIDRHDFVNQEAIVTLHLTDKSGRRFLQPQENSIATLASIAFDYKDPRVVEALMETGILELWNPGLEGYDIQQSILSVSSSLAVFQYALAKDINPDSELIHDIPALHICRVNLDTLIGIDETIETFRDKWLKERNDGALFSDSHFIFTVTGSLYLRIPRIQAGKFLPKLENNLPTSNTAKVLLYLLKLRQLVGKPNQISCVQLASELSLPLNTVIEAARQIDRNFAASGTSHHVRIEVTKQQIAFYNSVENPEKFHGE